MDLKKPKPILYDPMIIPRVKQYLEENVHQTYVDVGVMARLLQERYREYSRRKSLPFRQLVEQAYKTVLQSYGLDSDDNDDVNSDLEMMDDRGGGGGNHMNNMLTNMYVDKRGSGMGAAGGGGGTMPAATNDGELIDISSDDSDDEESEIDDIQEAAPATNAGAGGDVSLTESSKMKMLNNRSITLKKIPPPPPSILQSVIQPAPTGSAKGNKVAAPSSNNNAPPQKKRKVGDETTNANHKNDRQRPVPRTESQTNGLSTARNGSGGVSATASTTTTTSGGNNNGSSSYATKQQPKKYKREVNLQWSTLKFKDVGGIDRILKELCELLLHIKHPEVYRHIGLPPPRGFLLHGPPGCGKTLLAQAIAGQLDVCLIQVAATELVAGVSGESEERIRELFDQACSFAPCVLFIDEIDAISSNRLNAQKDMERRIVAQLLSSLDGLSKLPNGDQVLVIGATNRPDSLDPALRRVGRFDQEISLGIPDRSAREHILRVICANLRLATPFDYDAISAATPGYVGADLLALASRAASLAVKRAFGAHEAMTTKLLQSPLQPPITTVNLIDSTMVIDGADDADDDVVTVTEKVEDPSTVVAETVDAAESATTTPTPSAVAAESTDKPATETIVTDEQKPENVTEPSSNDEVVVEVKKEKMVDDHKMDEDDAAVVDAPLPPAVEEKIDVTEDAATEMETSPAPQPPLQTEVESTPKLPEPAAAAAAAEAPPAALTLNDMMQWLSNVAPPISDADMADLHITMDDFRDAVKLVQPSAKREGFITVPDVTWDDIGSLQDIREELQLAVLAPVKYPERLTALGLTSPSGVLLCGPPGCGKTLLAKAVANEAGINFISVKGPELLNMYVGESERAVRQCFQRARNSAPCVIFFDEFDSLCPTRSGSSENNSSSRVVNQLLTEMDGVEERKGVFLMAATNRPDIVDPAVLRPGRLDKILYVGMPATKDRAEILTAITKKKPTLANDVDIDELALRTDSYTGADLNGLVRQASLFALKDSIATTVTTPLPPPSSSNAFEEPSQQPLMSSSLSVSREHFMKALDIIRPSVSDEDKRHYAKLRQKYVVVPGLSSS